MARALIVGCGCRGRLLGGRLLEEGWAVRGTSRGEQGLAAIDAAGIEPALADPGLIGTVLELVGDVAVLLWLMGSAEGAAEEIAGIHGEKLSHLLERLVDTPVRGIVYEAAGSVEEALLEGGSEAVRVAGERWRIPVATVAADPSDAPAWVEAALTTTLGLTR